MEYPVKSTERTIIASPPMSPSLGHVLSSPVLYAVSFPPPRRKSGLWKIHTWVMFTVGFFMFFLIWLSFTSGPGVPSALELLNPIRLFPSSSRDWPTSNTTKNLYGVVFDAGSTGSRVHVFQLSLRQTDSVNSYVLTDELFKHIEPGLSSYADKPNDAAESLEPLLQAALNRLPKGVCSSTPVVVRATAGLRLLPSSKADNILSAVRQKLSRSCLVQSSDAVSILDGNLEGLYLWISLNFMTNRMPSPTDTGSFNTTAFDRTVGILDLGGGSTQITFSPRKLKTLQEAPDGFVTEVNTGKTVDKSNLQLGKHVYSRSYLGLGLMSARYSILHTVTKRLPAPFQLSGSLFSCCLPPGTFIKWTHGVHTWTLQHLSVNICNGTLLESELKHAKSSLQITNGSPILDICYSHALMALRDPLDSDRDAPVYPPSGYVVHRSNEILEQDFYAFSYIFDLATNVGLVQSQSGQRVLMSDLRDAADRVCRSPNADRPFECMDLSYIVALLHDGYGFPWNKAITLQKKIDSFEISWGLGAMFAQLSAKSRK